jgi:hypothetical protein
MPLGYRNKGRVLLENAGSSSAGQNSLPLQNPKIRKRVNQVEHHVEYFNLV